MKQAFKRGLLTVVSGATQRTAVLLPGDAADDARILPLRAKYRVVDNTVTYEIAAARAGELAVSLAGSAHSASVVERLRYDGPGPLILDLRDGRISLRSRSFGSVSAGSAITSRRFTVHFELRGDDGSQQTRQVGHYLPGSGDIGESYFSGDDYRDYEVESQSVHREVAELARRHSVRGPVLEVGCATGGTLAALRDDGYDVTGLDVSAWAVEQAMARLGNVVWRCDVEHDPIPGDVEARGPFGCLILASVLEHFDDPRRVLATLTAAAAPGAALILLTTNADSLTHRIFGSDWEGYFDWTHKSVDDVSARSIREWLTALGWHLEELRTWHVWTGSPDPTHATLRDWNASDARFRALLAERDLGDFISCVAMRP